MLSPRRTPRARREEGRSNRSRRLNAITAKNAKSAKGRGTKKENEQAAEMVIDGISKVYQTLWHIALEQTVNVLSAVSLAFFALLAFFAVNGFPQTDGAIHFSPRPVVKSRMHHSFRRNSNRLLVFCGDHVFIEFGFVRVILMSRVRLPERAGTGLGAGSIIAVAYMVPTGFKRKTFNH